MSYSSRFWLYAPLALFLALAFWAMSHWWLAAKALDQRLIALNGHQAIPGVRVAWSKQTISGFPFRLDVVFDDFSVRAEAPRGPLTWHSDHFALHSLTYGRTQDVFEAAGQQALAWTDADGFLHLRVTKQGNDWVSAEVRLTRSLGYGSYRFVVRDVSALEPAAVFAMFTLDDAGPSREMDIEVSRWGEPEDKSAQFVVQPYVVPANTVRFDAPGGLATYWIDWGLGRGAFRSDRGDAPRNRSGAVAEHLFTSGVPSPGNEKIHLNVYVYSNKRHPLQHEFEVVVEKFEFLP